MRAMTSREAEEILRGMDVENVNRDRLGIRVASLRAAGITDMEKLCALSVDQINEIKGISDDAAYLIYTIAGRIRQEVYTGLGEMKTAYRHAIAEKYRFFSYGDCCLLFRKENPDEI